MPGSFCIALRRLQLNDLTGLLMASTAAWRNKLGS